MTHIEAKADFFHNKLGIKACLPFASRCFIQKTKVGTMTMAMHRRAIFEGFPMLDKLPVIVLIISSMEITDESNRILTQRRMKVVQDRHLI
jgi:hypothetical protein